MKRVDLFFTAALVPLDYLTLLAAAATAYVLRFTPLFVEIRPVIFQMTLGEFMNIVFPITLLWIGVFAIAGLYTSKPNRLATEASRIILAVSAAVMVILAIAFFAREVFDSRFILIASWIVAMVYILLERLAVRLIQRALRARGIGSQKVVIIGKTKSGNSLKSFFDRYRYLGYEVTKQYTHFSPETRESILNLAKRNKADILLLANAEANPEEIASIKAFTDNRHLTFQYAADLFPASAMRPIIHTFAGQPVIELPKTPLDGWGAIYKRVFDILVSLILIILTLPIQIVTALLLLAERQGGVLFHHLRVGQRGKSFRYFKFRSMVKDAHKYRFDEEFLKKHKNTRDGSPLFKLDEDPRITKIGRFIRKTSIDEIPEFYLVLIGRMSLVGPRPHLPEEVEDYKPSQRKVLTIKPGISGMAQISGRATLSFDEEVSLDMFYIENWSPILDLIILIKTPFAVLFSKAPN